MGWGGEVRVFTVMGRKYLFVLCFRQLLEALSRDGKQGGSRARGQSREMSTNKTTDTLSVLREASRVPFNGF